MNNFDFCAPTRIIFGKGTEKEVGNLVKLHAKKILIHYGTSSIKENGLYEKVIRSVKNAGVEYAELGGVVANPRVYLVREGIKLCREENIELVLAVGGGSVIDSAKAISMGVYSTVDVWDIFENKNQIKKALPVACILTIPAAGSEASCHTVITNEQKGLKYGYGNHILRPIFSIINPEIFFTIPNHQIANGISDMLSHVFERYFTNTTKTDLTDSMCEAVMRTIIKNALILIEQSTNYDAWCEVGFGATVSHNDLLGMGREEDWACHKMEHPLSALYDIAHGAGLAILTPNWMEYVFKENPGIFAQFSVNVMGVCQNRDQDSVIYEGIKRLREFYKKMNLPKNLSGVGIKKEDIEKMAKTAVNFGYSNSSGEIGFLKKLNWQDAAQIYKNSF